MNSSQLRPQTRQTGKPESLIWANPEDMDYGG